MTRAPDAQAGGYMDAFRRVFARPEHRAFRLAGKEGAALLLHGLGGSPAEMRPLADLLYGMGWTVEVPLLPGHGAEIDQLFETDANAWVDEARVCLTRLLSNYKPVLVVGHSMGGAVALRILAELDGNGKSGADQLCGLILISPFIRLHLDNVWLRLFGPLLQLFVTRLRPFKDVDFAAGPNSAEIRAGIREFMPGLDMDDPTVQAEMRRFEVPTRLFSRLDQLGKQARQVAARVGTPTLVLQGSEDELVRPAYTRQLLTRLGGRLTYHEVVAGHNLVRTDAPVWGQVEMAVETFCSQFIDTGSESRLSTTEIETERGNGR